MSYHVVSIHNNSLEKILNASSLDDAKDIVWGLAEEKLNRSLTDEELDSLHDYYEVSNEEDSDNIWCISIGIEE